MNYPIEKGTATDAAPSLTVEGFAALKAHNLDRFAAKIREAKWAIKDAQASIAELDPTQEDLLEQQANELLTCIANLRQAEKAWVRCYEDR